MAGKRALPFKGPRYDRGPPATFLDKRAKKDYLLSPRRALYKTGPLSHSNRHPFPDKPYHTRVTRVPQRSNHRFYRRGSYRGRVFDSLLISLHLYSMGYKTIKNFEIFARIIDREFCNFLQLIRVRRMINRDPNTRIIRRRRSFVTLGRRVRNKKEKFHACEKIEPRFTRNTRLRKQRSSRRIFV